LQAGGGFSWALFNNAALPFLPSTPRTIGDQKRRRLKTECEHRFVPDLRAPLRAKLLALGGVLLRKARRQRSSRPRLGLFTYALGEHDALPVAPIDPSLKTDLAIGRQTRPIWTEH
jgi:hypothetical protein